MGTVALPISSLVNVQVSVAQAAAQAQNTTDLLVLTSNTQIPLDHRVQSFASLADVETTFGSVSIEADAATAWFGQSPQPTSLLIGRWAKTPASGTLTGRPLTTSEQTMTNWTSITEGQFQIAVNGFAPVLVEALDFSAQANLNGVATVINTAMGTAGAVASCAWNGSEFIFTSSTPGAASAVALMTPTVAVGPAVDIAVQLGTATSSVGATSVPGQDAESASDAVALLDLDYGYQWYALVIPEASYDDHIAIAQYIQGTEIKHFYGITTSDPATLLPNVDTGNDADQCLAQRLEEMPLTKTASHYSSTSNYAVISMLARIMTTDYTQNNSVITLMYKNEPTITAEFLNRTKMDALLAKNCNVFVAYQGGALIIQPGTTCTTNTFIDTIMGLDNLAIDLQLNIFNLLYTSPTKIPQTDGGMNMITAAAETVLLQYVANGFLAPGTWTQPGFGTISKGDFIEKGYYIYCPPLASQLAADRAARMAGPIEIGVKLAGAIHTVDALIVVNP
jgi:hypothetical protein